MISIFLECLKFSMMKVEKCNKIKEAWLRTTNLCPDNALKMQSLREASAR